jgi:hypothetical protein
LEPLPVSAASISSNSPLDFLRFQPQKPKTGVEPSDADAIAGPGAELLRMIQGVVKPTKPEKSASTDKSQDIYAEIKLGGKTIATIYNDGSTATSNALASKTKLSDGQGPDLAQKRAEELAEASGGAIVKPGSAITNAQWQVQQAGKPGAVQDPVQQEKQRSYSGLQERSMIADPSMLLQAQLFAQQTMGFDAKGAMNYVPPLDDRMSTEGTTA